MNRELKFRAWFDTKPSWCNQMFYSKEEPAGLGDWFSECSTEQDNYALMQFTGLQDKNNKKIYEGDILAFKINKKITATEFDGVKPIPSEETWYEEFLDHKILIAMVSSKEVAIAKINKYSGGHSASIITENNEVANEFLESVDSAAVYHNASTRFTDGFQFGLGGELAISTDKLHHRGPMGMQHLVTNKWYILGDGQIR